MTGVQSILDLFKGLIPKSSVPTPIVPYAPAQAALKTITPSPQFFTPVVRDKQETISKTVKPEVPVATDNQNLSKLFTDVRKTFYPTFDEQIQSVQNEARASFLPEVAKELAFAKDKEELLFRTPELNPKTGEMELTGGIIDPFLLIGTSKRIGIKGLRIAEKEVLPKVKTFFGKSLTEVEKGLAGVIEGTEISLKTLAGKITKSATPEEAVNIIKSEVSSFLKPLETKIASEIPKPIKFEPITVPRDFTKQIEKTTFNDADAADLVKRLDVLGLGTRSVRTFAEVEQAAQLLGTDVKTLLTITKGGPLSDVEATALKDTIATANKFITASQVEISRFPEKAIQLDGKIAEASKIIDDSLKKLVPGVTEIGRALSALRMQASESLDPAMWFLKAQRMLGPRNLTPEMQGIINNLIDNKDRLGLAQFVSMLRTASWAEKAATLWKAGLLTAFRTHEANILGNVTMATLETASNVVSTGFDVLASLITGKRTITFSSGTIAGKVQGFKTGISKAGGFFKTGTYSSDIMSKYEVRQVRFDNKILDGYTKAVFRSLGAEDIIFREAAMQEALVTQAEVIAKNAGLKGQTYKTKVQELLSKPTNEMVMNGIEAAEYQTFQQESKLAELLTSTKVTLQNLDSPMAKWGGILLEFIAPFAKTPINITKAVADYTPFGFVKAILNAIPAKTRSQQTFVKDMGRAVTGTGIITLGAYLAQNGLMTGNAPKEKTARDQFYAEGKQPNAILIGSWWFKLSRISPIGNLLSLGAEFHEQGQESEGTALVAGTIFGGVKTLTDMTFLQGVSSILNAVQDPEAYSGKYIQTSVASLIPTIVNHVARAIDPRLRVPESVLQAMEARIPFLSKEVPVRRDIFGNPVKTPGGVLALVNPFEPSLSVSNPIINEAKSLNISIGLPDQTISGTKLTNTEYSLYQKVQGKILEQTLKALIDSEGYKILTVSEKEKEFKQTITEVRQALNDQMFPALMIGRYNLPKETNPALLRIIIATLNKEDSFKRMSTERQGTTIKNLLKATGTLPQ